VFAARLAEDGPGSGDAGVAGGVLRAFRFTIVSRVYAWRTPPSKRSGVIVWRERPALCYNPDAFLAHEQRGFCLDVIESLEIDYWLVGDGAQPPERRLGVALDLKARLAGRGWRIVWGFARIPMGVALRMPEGAIVRLTGRSGAFLRGFIVHDGLVESEFNGRELCALVYCPWPRLVRRGERIAQMWALTAQRECFVARAVPPEGITPLKVGFGSTGR
jgi:dUTPase